MGVKKSWYNASNVTNIRDGSRSFSMSGTAYNIAFSGEYNESYDSNGKTKFRGIGYEIGVGNEIGLGLSNGKTFVNNVINIYDLLK